jgi:hypothetical protein
MMETERVSEKSVDLNHLRRLSAEADFVASCDVKSLTYIFWNIKHILDGTITVH